MINVDEAVLRRAVAAIELNLPQWNQNEWASKCKTSACLAGWILTTELGMTLAEIERLGINGADEDSWLEVPAAKALDLLGVTDREDRRNFNDDVFYYTTDWGDEEDKDDEPVIMRETPEALALMKRRLTDVTGVTFE